MATWKFRFDRAGNTAASGLIPSFSRDVGTIDPTGVVASNHQMRYDKPFRLCDAKTPTTVLTPNLNRLLGSGLDANGTDELMVFLDLDSIHDSQTKSFYSKLYVFTSHTPPLNVFAARPRTPFLEYRGCG